MTYLAKPRLHHPDLPKNKLGFTRRDYEGPVSTLCAGCGHDSISAAIIQAFYDLAIAPHRVAKLSGIGCSSKTPTYFLGNSHGFNSVHGRMPSVLTGAALDSALDKKDWDPSVKSLAAFPTVLQMMNEKLDLTQKLDEEQAKARIDQINKELGALHGEANELARLFAVMGGSMGGTHSLWLGAIDTQRLEPRTRQIEPRQACLQFVPRVLQLS